MTPPSEAVPSDTFTVGLQLQVYDIEMLLSTEKDTSKVVPGWVDVDNMVPGETVAVHISATGYTDLYATADPLVLTFNREGRQYFNLTVVLKEDAPLSEDFDIVVSAGGKTYLKSALSMVTLHVSLTYQLTATATLVSFPSEVTQGESAKGSILVTNTGSLYGEYELRVAYDPDSVVEKIEFTIEAELTPGFYEDFEFQVDFAEDAPTGNHTVTVDLWAITQYDTGERMDTFTVEVRVEETDGSIDSTVVLSLGVVAVMIIALVAAISLRRKA